MFSDNFIERDDTKCGLIFILPWRLFQKWQKYKNFGEIFVLKLQQNVQQIHNLYR